MKKKILEYTDKIDRLLNECDEADWDEVIKEHLIQIGFFQHERLIHLLVTLSFALMTIISIAALLITGYMYLIILAAAFMILLIPYVFHYYLLENKVQHMYEQYEMMLGKKSKNK